MKVLFVVQGYGAEISGGAESHCRMMATRLARRGHEVHVATSCAQDYLTWSNAYEQGASRVDDVTLHRFAVEHPRDVERFGALSGRVLTGFKPVPLLMQEQWIDAQGPYLPGLLDWLDRNAERFDATVFFTYLYYPTVRGLPLLQGRVPTVFHPLSHDEAPFYLEVFDELFQMPDGIAYSVEEDEALLCRRTRPKSASCVVGIGTELEKNGDGGAGRSLLGLADEPYLVCVGRVDSHKGSHDLYEYFQAYKARNSSDLKLVFMGESRADLVATEDIIFTGVLAESARNDVVAGALASVHPSYFESFSMALIEAWAQCKPTLVNARCDVLRGQTMRSGGGVPYDGFAEFEAAVEMLSGDEELQRRLGSAGRAYVEQRYDWEQVMDAYEAFLLHVSAIADASCGPSTE